MKLNNIEFDSPFTVLDGGNIIEPLIPFYAPSVYHSEVNDIDIESDAWEAFSIGYTGQDRYNGAVMHSSEQLGGALAVDILATPGTYVITAVNVDCYDEPQCYDTQTDVSDFGCDCEPAGWTVIKLKD